MIPPKSWKGASFRHFHQIWGKAPIGPSSLGQCSYWSIKFVPTNRSISPNLMVNIDPNFKNWLRKCPPQLLEIKQNTTKTYPEVSWHMGEGWSVKKQSVWWCLHWFEVRWKFRIALRGVAAAVSLFVNRETAMLSTLTWLLHCFAYFPVVPYKRRIALALVDKSL